MRPCLKIIKRKGGKIPWKNTPVFLCIMEHVSHIKKHRAALNEPHVPPVFDDYQLDQFYLPHSHRLFKNRYQMSGNSEEYCSWLTIYESAFYLAWQQPLYLPTAPALESHLIPRIYLIYLAQVFQLQGPTISALLFIYLFLPSHEISLETVLSSKIKFFHKYFPLS